MTPRPEDPCRDPASEIRDDHFDPDDTKRLGAQARIEAAFARAVPLAIKDLQNAVHEFRANRRSSQP